LVATAAFAQTAPPQSAPGVPPPAEQASEPAPAGFTYNAEGRRDPFVSLAGRGGSIGSVVGDRPSGLAGLLVSEVTLRGVVQTQGGPVAMLQGSDNRTYIVRPGERLFDGVVQRIQPDAMVILEDVNDPLSL